MSDVSISIDVPSLDSAEAFYCNALGCELVREGSKGIRILRAENVRIHLLEKHEGTLPFPGSETPRSYGRHWSPVHLDFGTADLEACVERIRAQGGTCEDDGSGTWGSIAYCADPFGNGFCLIRG